MFDFGLGKVWSTLIVIALAIALSGAAFWYVYSWGYNDAQAKCQVAALEEIIKSKERDLAVIQKKANEETVTKIELDKKLKAREDELEEYKSKLSENNSCIATDADVEYFNGKKKK
jgi:hypothetical protein